MGPGHTDHAASILVVDDFVPIRQELCSIIGNMPGCQVVGQASDGLEAVQKSAELRPDLILMDMALPTLDGIDAARRIWELSSEVKILFVSQESSIHIVECLLRIGAVGYVCKADVTAELAAAVLSALRGEQYVGRRFLISRSATCVPLPVSPNLPDEGCGASNPTGIVLVGSST